VTRATAIAWLRRNGPVLLVEGTVNLAAPALIYALLQDRWGEVPALIASSAPPLVWTLAGLARHRRIDALSMMVLVGIVLSLIAMAGGGSARFLQLREKLVTALIGMAFLGSAAIGRPLIGPLARATVARESAQSLAAFDARRDDPFLRHTIMVMTLAWGIGLMVDFAVSVALIYTISVAHYLIVGPVVGYVTIGGLTAWTVLYRRRRTRSAQAGAGA
jgi:hypothetical protein